MIVVQREKENMWWLYETLIYREETREMTQIVRSLNEAQLFVLKENVSSVCVCVVVGA